MFSRKKTDYSVMVNGALVRYYATKRAAIRCYDEWVKSYPDGNGNGTTFTAEVRAVKGPGSVKTVCSFSSSPS